MYVGKAKSLKNRVRSYFAPPIKLGPKTVKLVSLIHSVDYIEVQSEVEALLLEARLIKRFLPDYNAISRDDKTPYWIHIIQETFPRPTVDHRREGAIAGPFLSGRAVRRILSSFRRVAPFCTATRRAKLGRPCMYSHLGLCRPCPNDPRTSPAEYQKNIELLKRLLRGKFTAVSRTLTRQMQAVSASQNYEAAAQARDHLHSLKLLLAQPVSPDDYLVNPNLVADTRQAALKAISEAISIWPLSRIEMYDVANLSGTAATAAMTVATDGEINSKNFRHFTIRTHPPAGGQDDVAMLREVLTRRLKRGDWPKPDLIALDGGKSQLSIIKGLFPDRTQRVGMQPHSFIALAKKEEVITIPTPNGFRQIKLDRRNPGLQLLQRLRDEAHRFARRLHHRHRKLTYRSNRT